MPTPLEHMDDVVLCALAKDGDREAAGVLVSRHERFIWKVAKPIAAAHADRIDIEDLVQEGRIYMLSRIPEFDPSHGVKFLSWAGKFLWTRLKQAATGSGVIYVPNRWDRRDPRVAQVHSLDAPIGGGNGKARTMEDLLPGQAHDFGTEFDDKAKLAVIAEQMAKLPEVWQAVLYDRCAGRKLDEIGAEVGLTKERVRQIETQALNRLRNLCGTGAGGQLTIKQCQRA